MVDISCFINTFLKSLDDNFGGRIYFVGLQGSYGRKEETKSSDIDMVVILDELSFADIQSYNLMLDSLPCRELLCGFISGKDEIFNWDTSDLFQFYHDTTPIVGTLDELLPLIDHTAVNKAVKIGVCNIYHGCVHNMLYDKSTDILVGLYKSARFVIQAKVFLQTGEYARSLADILKVTSDDDSIIIENFTALKNGQNVDLKELHKDLFEWSKNVLKECNKF